MSPIFWLTGMPGAGKTTLAKALLDKFKQAQHKVIHLDGDELRQALQNKDYSREGRIQLAASYARLSIMLQKQQFPVIVSTVSLFHEIQQWNRDHIPCYVEVFLATADDVLQRRDQKQLYSEDSPEQQAQIVGKGIIPEYPKQPDYRFTIHNDTELKNAAEKLWQHYLAFCTGEV